jgi:adenylate cyclase
MQSPLGEPVRYHLKPGKNTLGRSSENDIAIHDGAASRVHAEIYYDTEANTVDILDLNSLNGTFVNQERLVEAQRLKPNDWIRIGEHHLNLSYQEGEETAEPPTKVETTRLTRELVLESMDHQALLLYEVATRLNTMVDLDMALKEVGELVKKSMGADRCELILTENFDKLPELGLPTSIARQALDQRAAVVIRDVQSTPSLGKSAYLLRIQSAMCVPVVAEDEIVAMIYIYKTQSDTRPFDQRDLQVAIAISHQAALTIRRMQLLKRIRREQVLSQLLQRFLSPREAEYILIDYLKSGQLPELAEHQLTVLVADIRNSTGMADRLGAKRFGEVLSRYFREMTAVIFEFGGIMNRYLGDGLMAVFGMTSIQGEAEERTINAALKMTERLAVINRDLGEKIEIGIGINSGTVVAGYLGTDERVEFTALGDPVNVAWYLETMARPDRILIGSNTYKIVAGKFQIVPLGDVELKGRTRPIGVYEVKRDQGSEPKTREIQV